MERNSMFLGRKNQYFENDNKKTDLMQSRQITNGIFHRTRAKNSQLIWEHKRPWIVTTDLRKKNGAERTKLPDFTVHYNVAVIKTVW